MQNLFGELLEFVAALRGILDSREGALNGAVLRAAFLRDANATPLFLTGCVQFQDVASSEPKSADYGYIVLVEDVIEGCEQAIERITDVLLGRCGIGGLQLSGAFSQTAVNRKLDGSVRGWGGWEFSSRIHRIGSITELYLRQDPLLAFAKPPYGCAAEAVARWVFQEDPRGWFGNRAPHQDELLTKIPDYRARITSAEWTPGIVRADIEVGTVASDIEVQVLFRANDHEWCSHQRPTGTLEWEVPDGTNGISIYLVDRGDECVAQAYLKQEYDGFGKRSESLATTARAEKDLLNGENESVEFKPWIKMKSPKEDELIETMIAFANTSGGRLYLGVNDRGEPLGDNALSRAMDSEPNKAFEMQIARIQSLRREKIKPVPGLRTEEIRLFGERILLVEIEGGTNPPYSTTIGNAAYVRKGASNRVADLHSEIAQYFRQSMNPMRYEVDENLRY